MNFIVSLYSLLSRVLGMTGKMKYTADTKVISTIKYFVVLILVSFEKPLKTVAEITANGKYRGFM
jgi:hypothetical protein